MRKWKERTRAWLRLSATTLRTQNCQIMTKAFQVSATADAVKTYGRAKETAYQLGQSPQGNQARYRAGHTSA